ncbi:hypothetical protein CC1G_15316 [Coprinopsis cinerea okayama7|uniref:Uncharacterized protein n=1 Tax=Coprinopsis cinerea (strain Okayama-7 / 130 / ATCC MYA-4618 / FGSC 9003) TaxID=240176 RepID=D6RPZ5_COPC7|nr:hypothetical protein CC1G_15316 [Coprinopsis cinerea okayama7\|eukprot:XP_002910409.1 hypothetical protein CC1G_15316 [Coprinopsis cinerea okayama7\
MEISGKQHSKLATSVYVYGDVLASTESTKKSKKTTGGPESSGTCCETSDTKMKTDGRI